MGYLQSKLNKVDLYILKKKPFQDPFLSAQIQVADGQFAVFVKQAFVKV